MEKSNANNRQVKRTRSWIIEALMLLMDKKPYNEISVSNIVEKAGIARQTFYRNYNNKDDVILQFFEELFNPNPVKVENIFREDGRGIVESTVPLRQFVEHANILKKILNTDAEHLIYLYGQKWETFVINLYAEKLSKNEQTIFSYIIKFQNYGTTRLVSDWIKNDMPIPLETIAELLRHLTSPLETAEYAMIDTAIPHSVLNIQKEE